MKNKIDWLIVVPNDHLGGGAEQLLMNVTNYLCDSGNHCVIYFLNSKKFNGWKPLKNKCKLVYSPFPSYFLGYIALFFFLIKFSIQNTVEYSMSSQTLINAMLGLIKKLGFLKKTKIIVRESNSIFHLLSGLKLFRYKTAYQIGYSSVDLLICQTDFMKNQLMEALPWMKQKLNVVVKKNPINITDVRENSISDNNLNSKSEYIVAAGRLVPAKGFDILIKSFDQIKDQFPNLELWILGEGIEKKSLMEMIRRMNLGNRVKLKGFAENPYPYFKNARMCVLSSRIEGFPNVLLQMMVLNTNIVSTLSAGEIENINGVYTCETENTNQLATTMAKCLTSKNNNYRNEFDKYLEIRTMSSFVNEIIVSA